MIPTILQINQYTRHLRFELHRAESTIQGYREELFQLISRHISLDEPETVAAYVGLSKNGDPLAPTTRNRRLYILRGFITYLSLQNELYSDPTARLKPASVPNNDEKEIPGVEDVERVLGAIRGGRQNWITIRDEAIVHLIFHVGLRVSEVRRLDLVQFDRQARCLRSVIRKYGGKKDEDLSDKAMKPMQRWIRNRPDSADPALFIATHGKRLSVRMIEKRFQQYSKKANISVHFHPHAVRHLHATKLNEIGTPTPIVMASMNHKSIVVTQRYIHTDRRQVREARGHLPELRPRYNNDKKK